MGSYLLYSNHSVPLPTSIRPSPQSVADWLERTLRAEDLQVERVGETTLKFRSFFTLDGWTDSRHISALVGAGEINVGSGQDGPVIEVSANPRAWIGLIPVAQLVILFGWSNVSELLRWGAGLGGLLLGGLVLLVTWGSLKSFFADVADNLRMLRTRSEHHESGAA